MTACPLCETTDLLLLIPRERIEAELALRQRFFEERIDGRIDPAQLKDRTDVLLGVSGEIRACGACGILVRVDHAPSFACDRYEDYVLEPMLRAHIDAFRRKAPQYRALLPEGARVLEIGSYTGAFLHVAAEWGWAPLGIDIGEDTARFSAAHGYPTRKAPLEQCAFDDASFDAVFIWNTFEQIEDPKALLREVQRIVRGPIVIRIPNAVFYAALSAFPLDGKSPAALALAYNNLLGFPHRYGYGTRSLDLLLRAHGFVPAVHHGDALISPSQARIAAWARQEENGINETLLRVERAFEALGERTVAAPWLEVIAQPV